MSNYEPNGLNSFYSPSHIRVSIDTGLESYTIQSGKDQCDINNIIRRYQRTGILEHINKSTADYIDLPDVSDYQASLNFLMQARDAFNQLPSTIRDEYDNDPGEFLAALGDPANHSHFVDLGIFKAPPTYQSPQSPPVDPAAK